MSQKSSSRRKSTMGSFSPDGKVSYEICKKELAEKQGDIANKESEESKKRDEEQEKMRKEFENKLKEAEEMKKKVTIEVIGKLDLV